MGCRVCLVALLMMATGNACATGVWIVPQDSGVTVRLRGISAVNGEVAWASGANGTVLRTVDGGKHWQTSKVPGASALDFRDIEGFDAETAVVLSIGPGEVSRIYRTQDGGKIWRLALQNHDSRAFFDCMVFDGDSGWMLGDPVDGRFQIYTTRNGGRDWELSANGPVAEAGEAAFAASGTCIARVGAATVFGSGGKVSRVHYLFDGTPGQEQDAAQAWQSLDSHLGQARESAGVFSLVAQAATSRLLVVGGDFRQEATPATTVVFARTSTGRDSSETQERTVSNEAHIGHGFFAPTHQPGKAHGYRSGVDCTLVGESQVCIAVGPSGIDRLDGVHWNAVSGVGYDAIDLAGRAGWVTGDAGRIARVTIAASADEQPEN